MDWFGDAFDSFGNALDTIENVASVAVKVKSGLKQTSTGRITYGNDNVADKGLALTEKPMQFDTKTILIIAGVGLVIWFLFFKK